MTTFKIFFDQETGLSNPLFIDQRGVMISAFYLNRKIFFNFFYIFFNHGFQSAF